MRMLAEAMKNGDPENLISRASIFRRICDSDGGFAQAAENGKKLPCFVSETYYF
jgi:hypothetical protein